LNKTGSPGCLTDMNNNAQAFYATISGLLQNLTSQLQGMIYSLGDAYNMTSTLMDVPLVLGEHIMTIHFLASSCSFFLSFFFHQFLLTNFL